MKLIVNPHKIELEKTPVNEKEIDITMCEFEFSDEITSDYVKEAYFTLKGDTYKQIIVNNQCSIPYEVLTTSGTVEIGVVAYLVENEEEIKRYNPSPAYFDTWVGSLKDDAENSQQITPSEMEQYEQALQDGLSEVNDKLDEIDTALGEVDNLDIDANKVDTTTTITVTKKDGTTKEVQVLDGNTGPAGRDGVDGSNGITPTIGDNGNWYLGDIDTGKPSRGIQGETGETGATGQDGISPTANVSKSGNTATITITDKNGTTTTTISDGTNGTDGRDGYVQYTAGDNISIENNVISAVGGDFGDYLIRRVSFPMTLTSFSILPTETANIYINELNTILNECKEKNKKPAIVIGNCIICFQNDGNLTGNYISFKGFYILGELNGNFSAKNYLNYASTYTIRFNYNITNNQISVYSVNNYDNKTQFLSLNNTATYVPTSTYHPATKGYVDENKGQTIQYSTMPTASSSTVGQIVQYIGTTGNDYTNGYFYIGIDNSGTYSWENINVQEGGSSTGLPVVQLNISSQEGGYAYGDGINLSTTEKDALKSIIETYQENVIIQLKFAVKGVANSESYILTIQDGAGKTTSYTFAMREWYHYSTQSKYYMNEYRLNVTGSWSGDTFTITSATLKGLLKSVEMYSKSQTNSNFLNKTNTTSYTPTSDYHPCTKLYADSVSSPVVTTSSTSTYTIASLTGNNTYKLGEITSLTITAVTTFDKESIIYFESGSTATTISIPDTLTNLGDVPTLTTSDNVSTGTCTASKNYIISVLNNIAIWKEY